MTVYYFNDEKLPITVKVQDTYSDVFSTLNPQEGKFFHLSLPEGSKLFVKKWTNMVMISYTFHTEDNQ